MELCQRGSGQCVGLLLIRIAESMHSGAACTPPLPSVCSLHSPSALICLGCCHSLALPQPLTQRRSHWPCPLHSTACEPRADASAATRREGEIEQTIRQTESDQKQSTLLELTQHQPSTSDVVQPSARPSRVCAVRGERRPATRHLQRVITAAHASVAVAGGRGMRNGAGEGRRAARAIRSRRHSHWQHGRHAGANGDARAAAAAGAGRAKAGVRSGDESTTSRRDCGRQSAAGVPAAAPQLAADAISASTDNSATHSTAATATTTAASISALTHPTLAVFSSLRRARTATRPNCTEC